MAAKAFALELEGYWPEANKAGVSAQSGIYCVYACTYDMQARTLALQRLIYIGESDNVCSRISNHEKQRDW